MKNRALIIGTALALIAGQAFAGYNLANTSKRGSLLIFPSIVVDPNGKAGKAGDTFVEITNDSYSDVSLECTYVNEQKGRVDFGVFLSGRATASWDVLAQTGDGDKGSFSLPAFPNNAGLPSNTGGAFYNPAGTSVYRGELICFAAKNQVNGAAQIAFNHLTGTATVLNSTYDPGPATLGTNTDPAAFSYRPWTFTALDVNGLPEVDGTIQGVPGTLLLTGTGPGTYDACPGYNVTNFMPNGATLGNLTTIDNRLSVSSCMQDLRQDFALNLTKLQFTTWNAQQSNFTGSFICADSVETVVLNAKGLGGQGQFSLNQPGNFDYGTLGTADGQYVVKGIASDQCSYDGVQSQPIGLLGVVSSDVTLVQSNAGPATIGTNASQSGISTTGMVLWDPSVGVGQAHRN